MAKRKREVAEGVQPTKALKSGKEVAVSAPRRTVRTESPVRKSRSKEAAVNGQAPGAESKAATATATATATAAPAEETDTTTVQIVTGSYERVLHGFVAAIPQDLITGQNDTTPEEGRPKINFSDTFLFHAHTSAIRCLAITPPTDSSSKVTLATGSTDARINLYSLSTTPPTPSTSTSKPLLPSLHNPSPITENSKNKELGALLHHASSITALYFPSRSKLLSASEDSTLTITRTRDWAPLSTIKAPIPKPQGRPSGDTAAAADIPAGINGFAVHPSMKLMLTVSKGEKCMRLWNLVTGKKAGVLTFSRAILASIGEARFGTTAEARNVVWDAPGDEFAVAFDRGVVVFGVDCVPKAKILPLPRTKIHHLGYLSEDARPNTLLVSTEDGRVLVYDTNAVGAPVPAGGGGPRSTGKSTAEDADAIPQCTLLAQIGGPAAGFTGRVKDFTLLCLPQSPSTILLITASSDGTVRLWALDTDDLPIAGQPQSESPGVEATNNKGFTATQVGRLVGSYSTGTRITCLSAFVMTGKPEEVDDEAEVDGVVAVGDDESGSSEDESE